MNEQFTPGPWFATKDSKYNEVARIGRSWNIGTELALSHFGDIDADSRLIAAAPDLLHALRSLLSDVGAANSMPGAVLARAAIAKATGAA